MVANRYRLFDETNIYLKYSITLGERDSITKSRQITSPPRAYISGTSNPDNTYVSERAGTLRKRLCLRVSFIVSAGKYLLYTVECAFHAINV